MLAKTTHNGNTVIYSEGKEIDAPFLDIQAKVLELLDGSTIHQRMAMCATILYDIVKEGADLHNTLATIVASLEKCANMDN